MWLREKQLCLLSWNEHFWQDFGSEDIFSVLDFSTLQNIQQQWQGSEHKRTLSSFSPSSFLFFPFYFMPLLEI